MRQTANGYQDDVAAAASARASTVRCTAPWRPRVQRFADAVDGSFAVDRPAGVAGGQNASRSFRGNGDAYSMTCSAAMSSTETADLAARRCERPTATIRARCSI
jgi:hypothetical protein